MSNSVVEKSPGRKIERKQYVVLIEKEVPTLFWQIVISSCRIIVMGGHGKDQLLKTSGRRSSLKVKQERISNMTYSVSALLWHVSPSLTHLTKVKNDLLAGWESWDHKWSLMTDHLSPTPVGLPTPMSTSIVSYHVHLNFDSGHAVQY